MNRNYKNSRGNRTTLEKALDDPTLRDQYLKEAEKFFMGPKGQPEHEKDLMRLHNAWGKKRFVKVVDQYIGKYGLPDEWGALMLILDLEHRPELVCEVIDKLVDMAVDSTDSEIRGLESKLRIIEMTSSDQDIQEAAQEALARL